MQLLIYCVITVQNRKNPKLVVYPIQINTSSNLNKFRFEFDVLFCFIFSGKYVMNIDMASNRLQTF